MSSGITVAMTLVVTFARAAHGATPPPPMKDADITASMMVPDGLEVTVWAKAPMFFNPTRMDVDERGRVWVAEAVNYRSYNTRKSDPKWHDGGDRIVILEDTDLDGKADSFKVFVQDKDLVSPLGVSVIGDKVLVSCSPNLIVYTKDAEDKVIKKEVLLTGFGGLDHDHALHNVVAGPDGRWYSNVGNAGPHVVADKAGWTLRAGSWYTGGSPYNLKNQPGLKSDDGRIWHGGLMLRVNPDGTGLRVLGHGFRNPYGTTVDSFGDLWMNDNDDTQSCRTTWLMHYSDLGYDSKDGSRSWQADKRPGQSTPAAHWRQDDPGVIPSGHIYGNGAPTGITHYEGGALGEKYAGGLLLSCEAGQNVVWGYLRTPQGAGYGLEPIPFLRSIDVQDPKYDWGKKEADPRKWFRPSDVAVGTDGAVYVCDWWDQVVGGHQMVDKAGGGTIYRIAPKGFQPQPPKYDLRTVAGLIELLKSPTPNVRAIGLSGLKQRPGEALSAVKALLNDQNRFVRARAIYLLSQLGEAGVAEVVSVLKHADPELRVAAYRALQLHTPDEWLLHAQALAADASPAVRREVALSMRGFPLAHREVLTEIAVRYDGKDRWYLEALGAGCEGNEEAMYAHLLGKIGGLPLKWSDAFADIAWRLHPLNAVPAFKDRALSPTISSERRRQAIDSIAFVADKPAALAMAEVAAKGPEDLRPYASWWLKHRSTNDWKSHGVAPAASSGMVIGRITLPATQPAFASPVLKQGGVDVDVDVTGATRLYLVATDAGDGVGCDWADWVNPVLIGPAGETRLTDLKWLAAENGWGTLNVNKNCHGTPLKVGGVPYHNGVGGHANLAIVYDLSGNNFTRFKARAGVDNGGKELGGSDYKIPTASVRFFVYLDRAAPKDDPNAKAIALQSMLLEADGDAAKVKAARALASTAEGGRILITLAEEGSLSDAVKKAVAADVGRNPDLTVRALAARYFPGDAPASVPSVDELMKLTGDAGRGRAVFLSEKAACTTCHSAAGVGKEIGPDLTSIQEKYDRAALYDAILNPSAAILSGYETYLVQTKDGSAITGFLVQDADPYVIRDTNGNRHSIPRASIEKRRLIETSVMPDNIGLGLSPQELADLVSYLQSKK